MLPGQLLHPRVPNRGDVLRTWARGGALFLEQTDGAPFLVRGLSILILAASAYAPGCGRVVEARQTTVRALA